MISENRPTLTIHDAREAWRCPQIGDQVAFEYCRRMNTGLPCAKLHQCWSAKFDVDAYLTDNFTTEEIDQVFNAPTKGRIGTMFDVLKRVQHEKDKNQSS